MSTTAKLIKRGFGPTVGLDRRYCSELWHVIGISEGAWKRSGTNQVVFSTLGFYLGSPHPDPGLAGAVCTLISLVEGPWIQGDGTVEAIVRVIFDSDRRWGGAHSASTQLEFEDDEFLIPTWYKGVTPVSPGRFEWIAHEVKWKRSRIVRIDSCNASMITSPERGFVFTWIGKSFIIQDIPYVMRNADIRRMQTNQTIIRYKFESSSQIPAFGVGTGPGTLPGSDILIPALDFLDEYARIFSDPPRLGVIKRPTPYFDPTQLPYWGQRFFP